MPLGMNAESGREYGVFTSERRRHGQNNWKQLTKHNYTCYIRRGSITKRAPYFDANWGASDINVIPARIRTNIPNCSILTFCGAPLNSRQASKPHRTPSSGVPYIRMEARAGAVFTGLGAAASTSAATRPTAQTIPPKMPQKCCFFVPLK